MYYEMYLRVYRVGMCNVFFTVIIFQKPWKLLNLSGLEVLCLQIAQWWWWNSFGQWDVKGSQAEGAGYGWGYGKRFFTQKHDTPWNYCLFFHFQWMSSCLYVLPGTVATTKVAHVRSCWTQQSRKIGGIWVLVLVLNCGIKYLCTYPTSEFLIIISLII